MGNSSSAPPPPSQKPTQPQLGQQRPTGAIPTSSAQPGQPLPVYKLGQPPAYHGQTLPPVYQTPVRPHASPAYHSPVVVNQSFPRGNVYSASPTYQHATAYTTPTYTGPTYSSPAYTNTVHTHTGPTYSSPTHTDTVHTHIDPYLKASTYTGQGTAYSKGDVVSVEYFDQSTGQPIAPPATAGATSMAAPSDLSRSGAAELSQIRQPLSNAAQAAAADLSAAAATASSKKFYHDNQPYSQRQAQMSYEPLSEPQRQISQHHEDGFGGDHDQYYQQPPRTIAGYDGAAGGAPDDNKARDAFRKFDGDGNGFLDIYEFMAAMKDLGMGQTFKDATEIFAQIDVDGGGAIEEQEFVEYYNQNYASIQANTDPEQKAKAMFRKYDEDGNGLMEVSEFVGAMRELGLGYSLADAENVFDMFDNDGGGTIEEHEFVEHYLDQWSQMNS
eukprot:CAMPEP_0174342062 /NCGR_PEP_ID=MMETSP0810-20121108/25883_1 /TAXON_ID=73025 ORGANISM="Eutreptiella gymnastica-like, Strain CCMP1594" /NCGR_SAMPLE_ID=MMETSP0810 /ASSEMBLY_ACC=CAM_ASM_000659 /LENGTH=441 /DNA_ID=CAMNT_0015464017 /DNA_START=23 /DNA_END=1349 /DNA_ORIENTATION=-